MSTFKYISSITKQTLNTIYRMVWTKRVSLVRFGIIYVIPLKVKSPLPSFSISFSASTRRFRGLRGVPRNPPLSACEKRDRANYKYLALKVLLFLCMDALSLSHGNFISGHINVDPLLLVIIGRRDESRIRWGFSQPGPACVPFRKKHTLCLKCIKKLKGN